MAKRTFGQRKIATKNNFTNREALEKGGMDTLAERNVMFLRSKDNV